MEETYRKIILLLLNYLEDEHMGTWEALEAEIKEQFGVDVTEWYGKYDYKYE